MADTAPFSEAGPPLITDDPDTPGKGHWEINLAYTLDMSARIWRFKVREPFVVLACGGVGLVLKGVLLS